MSDARTVLEQARALLTDRERWCQGTLAFDAEGLECDPQEGSACRWCLVGAIRHVSSLTTFAYAQAQQTLVTTLLDLTNGDHEDVTVYNDETSHEAVLELLDLAIREVARG